MGLSDQLARIRPESASGLTRPQRLLRLSAALALGATMGVAAKYADAVPVIGEIGTELGVWVLVATVLAAWSRSPRAAAGHVFAFFAAMLGAYYIYSMALFGFFPRYYFMYWGGFALLSPVAAYIVWYARGTGWVAALIASLPVALLASEGHTFYYTFDVPQGLACLSALLLFLILPPNWRQRLRVIPFAAIAFLLIGHLHLQSLLFDLMR